MSRLIPLPPPPPVKRETYSTCSRWRTHSEEGCAVSAWKMIDSRSHDDTACVPPPKQQLNILKLLNFLPHLLHINFSGHHVSLFLPLISHCSQSARTSRQKRRAECRINHVPLFSTLGEPLSLIRPDRPHSGRTFVRRFTPPRPINLQTIHHHIANLGTTADLGVLVCGMTPCAPYVTSHPADRARIVRATERRPRPMGGAGQNRPDSAPWT